MKNIHCCGRTADRRGFRAFLFIDILFSVLILSFIFILFFHPFKNGIDLLCLLRDRRIAQQRIRTVRAVLDAPLRFCALGVPLDAEAYKKALGSRSGRFFGWDGPLSVTDGKNGEEDACLRIVFAYPAACRTSAAGMTGKEASYVSFRSKLSRTDFDPDIYDKPGSIKNWVTFANSDPPRAPLTVSSFSEYSLKLRSFDNDEVRIPKGEELLLLRVLECWAGRDGIFYTNDHRASGAQPRENGVCDLRFRLEEGLLTIYVIARGEDKSLSPGRIEGEEKCTPEMLSRWRGVSEYVLYCEKFVVCMPNVPARSQ